MDGDQTLELTPEEGVQKAQALGLDLVEVAPLANPPVCKIMDFKNYLYNLKKKEKKQRKSAKKTETKTIRLHIATEKHDLEVKAKQARRFIEGRNLVKVVVIFHGREITHADLGLQKMNQFFDLMKDVAAMDTPPAKQGYQMTMMLKPL